MSYTTNVSQRSVEAKETPQLIASDKVEGTAVYDRTGTHLGKIHHMMIDKYSGQVAYAVAGFGGLFGIGQDWVPLPWKALNYDTRVGGYLVDEAKLTNAPRYATSANPDWSDRAYTGEIDQYWYPGV
ncbi:MAG: PRC-barrel domain-containing protein [Stellaceae bacterium]